MKKKAWSIDVLAKIVTDDPNGDTEVTSAEFKNFYKKKLDSRKKKSFEIFKSPSMKLILNKKCFLSIFTLSLHGCRL